VAGDNCTINSSAGVVIDVNGCESKLSGFGGRTDEGQTAIECPTGKK